MSITVNPVNDAPVANAQTVATDQNTAKAIALSVTDPDGAIFIYTVVTPPAHGTLSGTAPNVTYTPALNYNGPDSFTFTANDGSLESNVATVSITVASASGAPTAYSQAVTLKEDSDKAIKLVGNDPDGNKLKYKIVNGPMHGTLSGTPPSVTYRPATNYNGKDSFTFHVSDATHVSNDAVVSITIKPENDAPLASNLRFATATRTVITGQLVATDLDGNSLTYRMISGPDKGTVKINAATGVFTYTPDKKASGDDDFTYRANDGKTDSNTATVHIIIRNPALSRPPVASNLQFESTRQTPLSNHLIGSDDDDDVLTYKLISEPSTGKVVITNKTTGAFTYTPNPAIKGGIDRFTYLVNDGIMDSNVATVRIDMTDNDQDDKDWDRDWDRDHDRDR